MVEDKVQENRLRRWAKRLSLEVSKSRARKFQIEDQGGWQVTDRQGAVVAGERFELTLGDVAEVLKLAERWIVNRTTRRSERGEPVQEVRARTLNTDEIRAVLADRRIREGKGTSHE